MTAAPERREAAFGPFRRRCILTRIRVAILGTGFGRNVQAPAFLRHDGFELCAIAGSDAAKTRRIADELGVRGAYADWRELLARETPDLVSVVTPVALHHDMMCAALAAGAHVHCEKPTALDRFQARAMRDAAAAAGRVAGINHEFRFLPARRHALELVRQGAIGRPFRAEILGRYPIWHAAQPRVMNWLSDRVQGGGIWGALGSHHTDCLRLLFGEPLTATAVLRTEQPVRAPRTPGGAPGHATSDDAATVHYGFANGVTALVDLQANAPYSWERYEVHGDGASLRWDTTGDALWRIEHGREPAPVEIPAALRLARRDGDLPLVAPFSVMVERLHRAIVHGEPLEPNFRDDAVPVQCALDAARESSAEGRRVAVEPA
ncbi:MAG: Gfo/Idh/MocA family oxidoreductase [Candidatus Eisenbacteria bacterium]